MWNERILERRDKWGEEERKQRGRKVRKMK